MNCIHCNGTGRYPHDGPIDGRTTGDCSRCSGTGLAVIPEYADVWTRGIDMPGFTILRPSTVTELEKLT